MLDLNVPVAQVGSRLELQCSVDAWPAPRLGVYRDTNLTVGLVGSEDSRVNITAWSSRSVIHYCEIDDSRSGTAPSCVSHT